ncbi:MAG: hypothetical protein NTU44_17555 [Bacteroidetes bacterium]|nr:hypothetical protein [Bacteroidota bacterium]
MKFVIAIDEFQQILSFPEKNTDSWLRTVIQELNNIQFIFSGSQQHLMVELFNSPSRPFYRSTQFMKIGKIDPTAYHDFIQYHFNQNHRILTEALTVLIIDWTQLHTYYVQLLCNRVYATGETNIRLEVLQAVIQNLLKEQETVFFNYRDLLTASQWSLLKAIAAEKSVYSLSSREFLTKHNLGTSATVLQSLAALIKKEMVYKEYDSEGKAFYCVYDLLFQHWIRHS